MPTLLDLADLPTPDFLSGKSLEPLMHNPSLDHRSAIFAEHYTHTTNYNFTELMEACVHPNVKCIRTDKWKYIHYVGEPGELYNLQDDPGERNNLFDDPACRDIKSQLHATLCDWMITSEAQPGTEPNNLYFRRIFRKKEKTVYYLKTMNQWKKMI